jgi:hypothetical protein
MLDVWTVLTPPLRYGRLAWLAEVPVDRLVAGSRSGRGHRRV